MFHVENQTQNQNANQAQTPENHAVIYSDIKQLPKLKEGETVISQGFKQPARKYLVILDSALFSVPESVPANYASIIQNALQSAAKSILKAFVAEFSLVPSSVSKELFSLENILDKANDATSENLTKEELEELWKASETRKFYLGKDQYKTSSQYRKVFASFEELILKLQGNKAKFTADELDKILIKIKEEDFTGDFGQYVAKRVSYFKNKPVKETAGIDIL
jgi:hypothetical protein